MRHPCLNSLKNRVHFRKIEKEVEATCSSAFAYNKEAVWEIFERVESAQVTAINIFIFLFWEKSYMEGDHSGRRKNAAEDYSAEALPSAISEVEEDPLPWRLSLDSFRIKKQDSTDHSRQTWSSFLHPSSRNAFLASIFSLILLP
ncbi:hypothetical protein OIU85_023902 [Salix viminalis]|uniref:Uncharacterized protein n=1 Tax=Salix viminalis TaxID=40686 RepID=A0A9Q0Z444_SALVM|nr:hypothetical protein OIU85_023902 [Salix viminalis]